MTSAVDWALTREGLTPPKQLLLVALAWITDEDGVTFKGQQTIAARMGKDSRWVREHLPALAEAGLLSRYRRHRLNGSRTTDLVVLNLPRTEALDLTVYDGIVGELEPGDREPTGEIPPGGLPAESGRPTGENPPARSTPSRTPSGGHAAAREDAPDAFPDDMPSELEQVAIDAGKVLKRTAITRQQRKPVTRAAVGRAVLTYPDRDHVKVAREVEAWLLDGRGRTRPCADVVARFRSFLSNADPMPGPALAPNVHPIGRRDRAGQPSIAEIMSA